MKGTGWGFPYMGPLKETKTVAQSEGADSGAHFRPLEPLTYATIPSKIKLW